MCVSSLEAQPLRKWSWQTLSWGVGFHLSLPTAMIHKERCFPLGGNGWNWYSGLFFMLFKQPSTLQVGKSGIGKIFLGCVNDRFLADSGKIVGTKLGLFWNWLNSPLIKWSEQMKVLFDGCQVFRLTAAIHFLLWLLLFLGNLKKVLSYLFRFVLLGQLITQQSVPVFRTFFFALGTDFFFGLGAASGVGSEGGKSGTQEKSF